MDMIYLEKVYNEVSALNEAHKHTRRKSKVNDLDAEVYRAFIRNNPENNIKNSIDLNSLYCIYRDYTEETNDKIKGCMSKVLATQNNIKNIKQIFGKLKTVPENVLDNILCDKMSMRKLRDFHVYAHTDSEKINPNHLKSDEKIIIDDRIILSQLQCDVEAFLENIKTTANMARSNDVHNIPDYKDICTEMLDNISETMRSFTTLIA